VSNEAKRWGHLFYTGKSTPPAHRTGLFRPIPALPTPPAVGVSALPSMWAKARRKLGALIRMCGDGPVSNEATIMSLSILHGKSTPPAHRTELFRPTTALPTPSVGVPTSPWVWAKARSQLGALIRMCGDGAVSNAAAIMRFLFYTEKAPTEPGCSDPPPHSRRPSLAFPPRLGCGRRLEAN
jgi:hypothetical protein